MERLLLPTRNPVNVLLQVSEWSPKKSTVVASFCDDEETGTLFVNLDECEADGFDINDLLTQLQELRVLDDITEWEVLSVNDNSGDTSTSFELYTCVKLKRRKTVE